MKYLVLPSFALVGMIFTSIWFMLRTLVIACRIFCDSLWHARKMRIYWENGWKKSMFKYTYNSYYVTFTSVEYRFLDHIIG